MTRSYSPVEALTDHRPRLRDQWKLLARAVGWGVLASLAILYVDIVVVKLLVGIPALVLLVRDAWKVSVAMQPPVLGVEPVVIATARQDDNLQYDEVVEETVVIVEPGDAWRDETLTMPIPDSDPKAKLYDERGHVFGVWSKLTQPILTGLAALALAVLTLAPPDKNPVLMWVVIVGVVGVIAFIWGSEKLRRPALIVIVMAAAYGGSLASLGVFALVFFALLVASLFPGIRIWAKWFYMRYVVTKNYIGIEFNPPRLLSLIFILKAWNPTLALRKVDSVESEQSWIEKVFNIDCGTMVVDAPGDKDEMFNKMYYMRDLRRLEDLLHSLVHDRED